MKVSQKVLIFKMTQYENRILGSLHGIMELLTSQGSVPCVIGSNRPRISGDVCTVTSVWVDS